MKCNLAVTTAQVDTARKPEIGLESKVFFAPENCVLRGTLDCSAAAVGVYTSAGGADIPVAGRDVIVRVNSPKCMGVVGAMAVTFNVTLEGSIVDTATATFDLPTWSGAGILNLFPIGICADLVPTTPANLTKKVMIVGTLVSVANMTVGNQFQLYTTPLTPDFIEIEAVTTKGGAFNLPEPVPIASGRNPAMWMKLGRGTIEKLSIGFADRGYLEQLNRFNGSQGTIRIDAVKDGYVTAQRLIYSGWFVRCSTDRGDGDAVADAKAEGSYEQFMIGYMRPA